MVTKSIISFLNDSVKYLKTPIDATRRMCLDDDFSLYAGWRSGFSKDDTTILHNDNNPEYGLCIKIAEGGFSYADAYMPMDILTGETYNTEITIGPDANHKDIAKSIANSYKEMKKMYDAGNLIL